MKKNKLVRILAVLLAMVMIFAVVGCGKKEEAKVETKEEVVEEVEPEKDYEDAEILIAAAASLKNAYDEELIPLFQETYPGITVTGTYDASGKLQTQIEEGLEADLFMSAATKQMDALLEENLIDADSVVELVKNKLVIIAPVDTATKVTGFDNITEAETVAIGDPESVPVGQYAQTVFEKFGNWADVEAKATKGGNVTEVLNWVAEGSAEVGVVYATDALSNDKVKVVAEADEAVAGKVIYPVGIVTASKNKEAAQLFEEFLQTPEALAIFEKYGFTTTI
jgi:molybdate transport system substrate-binding protein